DVLDPYRQRVLGEEHAPAEREVQDQPVVGHEELARQPLGVDVRNEHEQRRELNRVVPAREQDDRGEPEEHLRCPPQERAAAFVLGHVHHSRLRRSDVGFGRMEYPDLYPVRLHGSRVVLREIDPDADVAAAFRWASDFEYMRYMAYE